MSGRRAHYYRRRVGLEHVEIVLPMGSDADWAGDRAALWDAAEVSEKRKDARVACEIEVLLPRDLSADQRIDLIREYAQDLADRYEVAVDFAIYSWLDQRDIRRHFGHILMTTRKLGSYGSGEKTVLGLENKWLRASGLPIMERAMG